MKRYAFYVPSFVVIFVAIAVLAFRISTLPTVTITPTPTQKATVITVTLAPTIEITINLPVDYTEYTGSQDMKDGVYRPDACRNFFLFGHEQEQTGETDALHCGTATVPAFVPSKRPTKTPPPDTCPNDGTQPRLSYYLDGDTPFDTAYEDYLSDLAWYNDLYGCSHKPEPKPTQPPATITPTSEPTETITPTPPTETPTLEPTPTCDTECIAKTPQPGDGGEKGDMQPTHTPKPGDDSTPECPPGYIPVHTSTPTPNTKE